MDQEKQIRKLQEENRRLQKCLQRMRDDAELETAKLISSVISWCDMRLNQKFLELKGTAGLRNKSDSSSSLDSITDLYGKELEQSYRALQDHHPWKSPPVRKEATPTSSRFPTDRFISLPSTSTASASCQTSHFPPFQGQEQTKDSKDDHHSRERYCSRCPDYRHVLPLYRERHENDQQQPERRQPEPEYRQQQPQRGQPYPKCCQPPPGFRSYPPGQSWWVPFNVSPEEEDDAERNSSDMSITALNDAPSFSRQSSVPITSILWTSKRPDSRTPGSPPEWPQKKVSLLVERKEWEESESDVDWDSGPRAEGAGWLRGQHQQHYMADQRETDNSQQFRPTPRTAGPGRIRYRAFQFESEVSLGDGAPELGERPGFLARVPEHPAGFLPEATRRDARDNRLLQQDEDFCSRLAAKYSAGRTSEEYNPWRSEAVPGVSKGRSRQEPLEDQAGVSRSWREHDHHQHRHPGARSPRDVEGEERQGRHKERPCRPGSDSRHGTRQGDSSIRDRSPGRDSERTDGYAEADRHSRRGEERHLEAGPCDGWPEHRPSHRHFHLDQGHSKPGFLEQVRASQDASPRISGPGLQDSCPSTRSPARSHSPGQGDSGPTPRPLRYEDLAMPTGPYVISGQATGVRNWASPSASVGQGLRLEDLESESPSSPDDDKFELCPLKDFFPSDLHSTPVTRETGVARPPGAVTSPREVASEDRRRWWRGYPSLPLGEKSHRHNRHPASVSPSDMSCARDRRLHSSSSSSSDACCVHPRVIRDSVTSAPISLRRVAPREDLARAPMRSSTDSVAFAQRCSVPLRRADSNTDVAPYNLDRPPTRTDKPCVVAGCLHKTPPKVDVTLGDSTSQPADESERRRLSDPVQKKVLEIPIESRASSWQDGAEKRSRANTATRPDLLSFRLSTALEHKACPALTYLYRATPTGDWTHFKCDATSVERGEASGLAAHTSLSDREVHRHLPDAQIQGDSNPPQHPIHPSASLEALGRCFSRNVTELPRKSCPHPVSHAKKQSIPSPPELARGSEDQSFGGSYPLHRTPAQDQVGLLSRDFLSSFLERCSIMSDLSDHSVPLRKAYSKNDLAMMARDLERTLPSLSAPDRASVDPLGTAHSREASELDSEALARILDFVEKAYMYKDMRESTSLDTTEYLGLPARLQDRRPADVLEVKGKPPLPPQYRVAGGRARRNSFPPAHMDHHSPPQTDDEGRRYDHYHGKRRISFEDECPGQCQQLTSPSRSQPGPSGGRGIESEALHENQKIIVHCCLSPRPDGTSKTYRGPVVKTSKCCSAKDRTDPSADGGHPDRCLRHTACQTEADWRHDQPSCSRQGICKPGTPSSDADPAIISETTRLYVRNQQQCPPACKGMQQPRRLDDAREPDFPVLDSPTPWNSQDNLHQTNSILSIFNDAMLGEPSLTSTRKQGGAAGQGGAARGSGGTRLLGELAFQVERRILDHVFCSPGFVPTKGQRRYYGYTVANLPCMMHSEATDPEGHVDREKEYTLRERFQRVLDRLRLVGYDHDRHSRFAQTIINRYGLLDRPRDSRIIELLNNAASLRTAVERTCSSGEERVNMLVLLECLVRLSAVDGIQLFRW